MITFDEALNSVLGQSRVLSPTRHSLERALGKVLAEDVAAPFPLPQFNNSRVDGYAVRSSDFAHASKEKPVALAASGIVKAGDGWKELRQGKCLKIMTGALIPEGADAVVMKEEAGATDPPSLSRPVKPGENIRYKGEEVAEGDILVATGTMITPPVIALLASVGMREPLVWRAPLITILVTGDELAGDELDTRFGQIFDSVGPALLVLLNKSSKDEIRLQRSSDIHDNLFMNLKDAIYRSDIVVTVGGVSVGDYDLVRGVCEELGVEQVFWRIAIKPGMPLFFGKFDAPSRTGLVFGLPGNPVAALVTAKLFVVPAIRKMMGVVDTPRSNPTALLTTALQKPAGRLEFVRAVRNMQGGSMWVTPVRGQESHMLTGLAQADCLINFSQNETHLSEGDVVEIIPLEWNL